MGDYLILRRSYHVHNKPTLRCYAGGQFTKPGYVSVVKCLEGDGLTSNPLTNEWEAVYPPATCPNALTAHTIPNCLVAPDPQVPHATMVDDVLYMFDLQIG